MFFLDFQIKDALNKLVEIKAIECVNGKYQPLKKSFKVPDNFGNLGLDSFYRNSLDAAKEAIDLPPQIRRFKSLYLPLNEKEFELYLNNLQEFVTRQIQQFDKDDFAGRSLYQVNFNIIPATFK